MTEVSVPVMTAIDTSAAPRDVAVLGSSPCSWWRKMFSITTTALSTSMPMATMSPKSTSVFIDPPRAHMKPHATTSENGMHATDTSVVDTRRRNANSTHAAKMAPKMPVKVRSRRVFLISAPWLNQVRKLTPSSSGSLSISAMRVCTASHTSTVLAFDSCAMVTPMAKSPSKWRPYSSGGSS